MGTALRVIAGGQQRMDEAHIEVLSLMDETSREANELYDLIGGMEADYRRMTGTRDLRFRSATWRLARLARHASEARAEYVGLTGGAA